MNPRTKLAFFGDDDDDLSLLQAQSKPIDDQKAKTYSQGILRKSKREKEKEAEVAKREEEEREAAKAYAEFLDAFDAPSTSSGGSKSKPLGFVKASDGTGKAQAYEPVAPRSKEGIPTGPRAVSAFNSEYGPPSANVDALAPHQRGREPTPPPAAPASKPKGKRAMDMFLEELKRDQADREARLKGRTHVTGSSVTALAAFEGQHGSRDRGDPLTTNVFVANLPMGVTEHSLGMFFARHGPVGSVKIMWPRSDNNPAGPGGDITARRGKAAGMSGFVSYMTRKSAEECVREMDGFTWGGCVLRVGWSKAVPIAAKPAYGLALVLVLAPKTETADLQNELDTTARLPGPAQGLIPLLANRASMAVVTPPAQGPEPFLRDRGLAPETENTAVDHIAPGRGLDRIIGREVEVARVPMTDEIVRRWPPIDEEVRKFVITVAERVKKNGSKFGDMVRHKERDNPKFSFLYDKRMPEYHLFRSLAERDYKCPYADIPFNDDGGVSPYSTDTGEDSEKERARKGSLGRLAQRRFENMLRTLSGRKGEIAACMVFSLEHADAVTEVVDIIISSLLIESTPVPRKIARLHVICDILHNSAATIPNAWKFRQEFQARLPAVFDHLGEIYQSFPGRITANVFKKQVLTIVEVWEDWIIFPPDFTTDMRNRLEGVKQDGQEDDGSVPMDDSMNEEPSNASAGPSATAPSKFRTSTFKPAEVHPVEDDEDMDIDDSDADLEGDAIPLDGDELDV